MQTKGFWWEVKKKLINKVTKKTNKGDLVKDEKVEKWEKARRLETL
jgi:hypothetical protein